MSPKKSVPKEIRIPQEAGWQIGFHDEFVAEARLYSRQVQKELAAHVELLMKCGPNLSRPHVDTLKGSGFPNMKELRFQVSDGVWRIAFAFDPKRRAILLVGGDKSGISQGRFYGNLIRLADQRFRQHLQELSGNSEG